MITGEAKKLWHRNYYENNKQKYADAARLRYAKDKVKINEARRKNPFSLYSTIKRNARIRGISCGITKEEFSEWWFSQEQECCYCDVPVARLVIIDRSKKMVRRLSIDRVDNEIGYEKGNLALACLQCNFIKSNLFSFEEMREIGQKYLKPKWLS